MITGEWKIGGDAKNSQPDPDPDDDGWEQNPRFPNEWKREGDRKNFQHDQHLDDDGLKGEKYFLMNESHNIWRFPKSHVLKIWRRRKIGLNKLPWGLNLTSRWEQKKKIHCWA